MIPILGFIVFGIALKVHPIFVRISQKYDAMNKGVPPLKLPVDGISEERRRGGYFSVCYASVCM